jgi:hypothetical protein
MQGLDNNKEILSIPVLLLTAIPVLLSTAIRSRFQVKPATLVIPIYNFLILLLEECLLEEYLLEECLLEECLLEELYGTQYQSNSFFY